MTLALQNLPDEELAQRARAGSAPCYEEIVRRYQVPLLRFLTRRFPSRHDAEDILQDTYVKAWQNLHLYDPQYAFRTWLYTIAYRLAVSRHRREPLILVPLPEHTATPDSGSPSPDHAVENADTRAALWQHARKILSAEQYLALWLFYVDEMPAGDVAKILNRSWVSVKTMLHRARKKLAPYVTAAEPVALKAGDL
jgi:RNA polymerase sigma-70 factor (ECF subfamily)